MFKWGWSQLLVFSKFQPRAFKLQFSLKNDFGAAAFQLCCFKFLHYINYWLIHCCCFVMIIVYNQIECLRILFSLLSESLL